MVWLEMFARTIWRKPVAGGSGAVKLKDGRVVDLELYKFDLCPFCVYVYRYLDQLAIRDQIRMRDTRNEDGAAGELLQRGGKVQVPCLFIDGEPMYESVDIARWLVENVDR